MNNNNNNIIIIGAGNMGRALAKGLLKNPDNIIYFKTKQDTTSNNSDFSEDIATSRVFFHTDNDFLKNIKNPWIILAVKPHYICSLVREILDILTITEPKALICVAAGIDIASIRTVGVPVHIPIIRTMPNISVATGQGVVGYILDNEEILSEFVILCTPLGLLYPLQNEAEFHLFTALAGSSPAFFLHTIEAMAQAASELGIDYASAENIATQVFIGTASLLHAKSKTPKILRDSVTSPNGTTQAGLEILINKDLSVTHSNLGILLKQTLQATGIRSQEIQKTILNFLV